MAKAILFIEGAPASEASGNLQAGFTKLLEKKLGRNLPRIVMGGGKSHTADKFLLNRKPDYRYFALLDLDKIESFRQNDLHQYALQTEADNVFYMIQEMESWLISQPDVLNEYYGVEDRGKKVSERLAKTPPAEIGDPKKVLKDATRLSKRKEYHETKHAPYLLELLDADKLCNDFEDFRRLIVALQ